MRREKEVAMVAGHLQEKNGYFYAVLSYKDAQGKRKTKWIPTGYLIRGNKKKAEVFSKNEPEFLAARRISRQLNKILSMFKDFSTAFLVVFLAILIFILSGIIPCLF